MPRLNIMPPSVSSETMRRCGKPTANPNACGVTQPSCCWNRLALRICGAALYHSSTLAPSDRTTSSSLSRAASRCIAFDHRQVPSDHLGETLDRIVLEVEGDLGQ